MLCREPEKGTVFDWRAKLKEEEKDNDPKNMWKKFDSAGPMKAIISFAQVWWSLQYLSLMTSGFVHSARFALCKQTDKSIQGI